MTPIGTTVPVIGTTMSMGLTNGRLYYGLSGTGNNELNANVNDYGEPIGQSSKSGAGPSLTMNITSDPAKSGVIADLSKGMYSIIKY